MVDRYYDVADYKARQSLSYLTRRVAKLVTSQLETLFESKNMSFVQYAVLMNIRDGLAMTASEICQRISHDMGALTRIIDQLDQRGFLQRERSDTDRRRVEMTLTPAGEAMLLELIHIVVDFWNELLVDYSREEVDMMTNILSRMTDQLSNQPKAKG